jgi:hypothetical protein
MTHLVDTEAPLDEAPMLRQRLHVAMSRNAVLSAVAEEYAKALCACPPSTMPPGQGLAETIEEMVKEMQGLRDEVESLKKALDAPASDRG